MTNKILILKIRAFVHVVLILFVGCGPILLYKFNQNHWFVDCCFSSWKIIIYFLIVIVFFKYISISPEKLRTVLKEEDDK